MYEIKVELSASNILRKPISPFCVPLNLILYLLRAGLRYREDFCEIILNRDRREREIKEKKQIWVQIGQYSNRRDVSEKKYKIKEIKRRLREKRISEVLQEKEREREKETVRSSITVDLSPYRIFEIRVRVTLSGRISLITTRKYEPAGAKVISDFA